MTEREASRLPADEQRDLLVAQAAKLFHILEKSKVEIAEEMGLTRWQVSRLLQDARDLGIVRIEIVPRMQRRTDIEAALQRVFGLREAIVLPDAGVAPDAVAQAAGQYLAAIKPRVSLIGVSWGRTMASVARWLPPKWSEGTHVVQVNGAVSLRSTPGRTNAVAETFAEAASGVATLLPAPAIVGNARTREVLEQDRIMAEALALAGRAQVLAFSLGALSRASVLVTSGCIDAREIDYLQDKGAVGDILGRFVDRRGAIVDPALDARTIGLPLEHLRGLERVIGVTSGPEKHAVTLAALRAGYINILVTDQGTAQHALDNAHVR